VERVGHRKAPPYSGHCFWDGLWDSFQAREPSHLAVSEACREKRSFSGHNANLGNSWNLEDLWVLRQHIVSVHRIPFIEVTPDTVEKGP
jgi:hypothetical protein